MDSTTGGESLRIIVTGGYGFIGSNLILALLERHPSWSIVNVDAVTYAADPANLASLEADPRYEFRQIDIVNRDAVRALVQEVRPDGIFHLAAESHVDNSIRGPEQFILTNVLGTFNLLEEARQAWGGDASKRFLHISTDEVYGSLGDAGAFTEESRYEPNSPYSASKAGSDHLVRAWHHTYGMNVVTTNCSNNYGPRQHREKLIPTVIATALAHRPIPVYGRGLNVRDWLYVADHCAALDLAFTNGRAGETYVVGGRNEWRNIDLVRMLCRLLDEEVGAGPDGGYESLITFVIDRPGHDARYAIDPSKIESELGWRGATSFEDGLRATVRWYAGTAH
ncbi:MAG: dTDP-glucose 4,6-dehydratase [Bacteroidetes bacterium]|nr:dTDP-glucose 4,6-dehydratase [Bacteroidota bacterium]